MKIEINFDEEKFGEIAEAYFPELVRQTKCCNGRDCGCGGVPDSDNANAVEQLEKELLEDIDLFTEIISEYSDAYDLKEVY